MMPSIIDDLFHRLKNGSFTVDEKAKALGTVAGAIVAGDGEVCDEFVKQGPEGISLLIDTLRTESHKGITQLHAAQVMEAVVNKHDDQVGARVNQLVQGGAVEVLVGMIQGSIKEQMAESQGLREVSPHREAAVGALSALMRWEPSTHVKEFVVHGAGLTALQGLVASDNSGVPESCKAKALFALEELSAYPEAVPHLTDIPARARSVDIDKNDPEPMETSRSLGDTMEQSMNLDELQDSLRANSFSKSSRSDGKPSTRPVTAKRMEEATKLIDEETKAIINSEERSDQEAAQLVVDEMKFQEEMRLLEMRRAVSGRSQYPEDTGSGQLMDREGDRADDEYISNEGVYEEEEAEVLVQEEWHRMRPTSRQSKSLQRGPGSKRAPSSSRPTSAASSTASFRVAKEISRMEGGREIGRTTPPSAHSHRTSHKKMRESEDQGDESQVEDPIPRQPSAFEKRPVPTEL